MRPFPATSEFQLIANNPGFAPYVQDCEAVSEMNGYVCNAAQLGILLFESEDSDRYDRSM